MSHSTPQFKCLAFLAAAIVPLTLMTGCGVGSPAAATDTIVAGVHGVAHGGVNPVINSTVTLYATTTAAYGTGGTQLAQTTTDANGAFAFTNAATCPAGQQAYITASQGNTGGNTNNANVLLMAALGPCEGISSATNILMSEVSTVAAGYALSNFIGIDADGVTVHVSAPLTNNSPSPSCSGTGSTQFCFAAGLSHAFLNAANLVNASSNTGSATGATYTTTPGNTNGIVPTLLINTLGNILQSCVNSTGGAAGDSTNCGLLFTNTTPPATSTTSPVTPKNTLQAVINLAKFPTMTSTQIAALFALSAPQTFFTPALAAAPSDFTLAIAFVGPTASTNFIYPFFTVLDITDTSYTFTEAGNGTGFGPVFVAGMSSNGASGYKSVGVGNALCTAGSPCAAGVDSVGNLWLANTNGATNNNVYELKASDGTLETIFTLFSGTAPNSAAVDKYNNVFVTSAVSAAPNLFMKAPTDSGFTSVMAGSGPTAVTEVNPTPEFIAIDGTGSIWNTNFLSSTSTPAGTSTETSYLQNTGTTSAVFGNSIVSTTESSTINNVESIAFDSSNNGWVNNQTVLYEVAPGAATPTASFTINGTGGASATAKNASSARFMTLDGDGNIILPDNQTTSTVWQFYNATGKFVFFAPCLGNSGTACDKTADSPRTPQVISSRNAVTDSTGSVWITNPITTATSTTAGSVVQIIGTAAPTWPQLSYGRPGVRP